MESRKTFMIRGRKSLLVPVTRPPLMMAPLPVTESPVKSKSHRTSYNGIMNELANTKSRIFKVCCM